MTTKEMTTFLVTIKLFAMFREATGKSEIKLTLSKPTTISELKEILTSLHPELFTNKIPYIVSVNQQVSNDDILVAKNDEVALLPPVSGGQ